MIVISVKSTERNVVAFKCVSEIGSRNIMNNTREGKKNEKEEEVKNEQNRSLKQLNT